MARNVLWFRRDLRLADHPALTEAASRGEVVPLFVLDPALLRTSAVRTRFLLQCLAALDESIGGALVVRTGEPRTVVPAVKAEAGADAVLVTGETTPYGRRRDEGLGLEAIGTPYAVDPGAIKPYRVFTPFSRAWAAHGWADPLPEPDVDWASLPSDGLPPPPDVEATLPPPGEGAAHDRLATFLGGTYERERPAVDGTTRLSPYLKYGCLHPRQLLAATDDAKLRSEVAWRDFYAHVVHFHPRSTWNDLRPDLAHMAYDHDEERFRAWREGRTGYPIVDAGMRQLLGEAWVHNRVRMIVASFLVKDLHLPWQWGARWFLDHLVDGDVASNSHGWQWVAGTGTDPAPYFRVFNPTLQGRRFDPDGEYVRRWLPDLGPGDPHEPRDPIVDHAAERKEALARYSAATGTR